MYELCVIAISSRTSRLLDLTRLIIVDTRDEEYIVLCTSSVSTDALKPGFAALGKHDLGTIFRRHAFTSRFYIAGK